jgi:gamma-carbonic anhydrase
VVYYILASFLILFLFITIDVINSVTSLYAGDVNTVSIGSGTNIQDNSLVHVAKSNLAGKVFPTIIGDNVTVGNYII